VAKPGHRVPAVPAADALDRAIGSARLQDGPWLDAQVAAALFAVDPAGMGGVLVRAPAGPVRDRWLATVTALLPAKTPVRRLPLHAGDGRLMGGLDLARTLGSGKPVVERGLLAEADGGVLVAAMAERMAPGVAARLGTVLDTGEVRIERDGIAATQPARFGVLAFDERCDDEPPPPTALADRLAIALDLELVPIRAATLAPLHAPKDVANARRRLARVVATPAVVEALCATSIALGVASLRAPVLALRVACAAAALDGRASTGDDDAILAARLVLAPRATCLPATEAEDAQEPEPAPPDAPPENAAEPTAEDDTDRTPEKLDDVVLAAAQAAIPPDLLAKLQRAATVAGGAGGRGTAGKVGLRGRPAGARRGDPGRGARLDVVETLRVAAPWQRLRRRERGGRAGGAVEVRRDDFRVKRFRERTRTTTIFVVDASGSAALHRLAEAKGAVELMLADCYVRRDQVALVAFRDRAAEELLPPTRSLVRAKRGLAGLPGGGGTPLAHGIDTALGVVDRARRRGETPVLVLLTDGRANIARDGSPGRPQAMADALAAAERARVVEVPALVIDTSARPQDSAAQLATAMGARYLPLPYADAARLDAAVRGITGNRSRRAA
jgi:magnesium chelatase subunit D